MAARWGDRSTDRIFVTLEFGAEFRRVLLAAAKQSDMSVRRFARIAIERAVAETRAEMVAATGAHASGSTTPVEQPA